MGWGSDRKLYGESFGDFARRVYFTWKNEPGSAKHYELLDLALVGLKELYAAVKVIDTATGSAEVIALIGKITFAPKDHYNVRSKLMQEGDDLGISRCPERILNLLTETDSEYANKWRARCRQNIEASKQLKFKVGDRIVFSEPINFKSTTSGDGYSVGDFIVRRIEGPRISLRANIEHSSLNFILTRNYIKEKYKSGQVQVFHADSDFMKTAKKSPSM